MLDLDVRAFFDSVPHSLVLKAVAHHTSERWVLLYISRWLNAPMQMPDGTMVPREKGTPQGSPISPLLANLFMHYAFDTWMDREFPGCPFERYADDIVAHCDSEEQARELRAAIAERLGTLGLELHPVKTKIVYCKDANRRGDFEHASFDFLGYTFRGRLAKGPRGYFTGFSPAISAKAKKAKGKQIRDWHLNRRSSADLSGLADQINPQVQGLDQLLRGLLPLRVVLPRMAYQRAPRPVGHAQVQAIPRQVRQSDGLAAKGLPVPASPIRPLAAGTVPLVRSVRGAQNGIFCRVA